VADITWQNVSVRLGDLEPWARNPRQIKADQARRLADSFATFGQVETIAIGPSGEVYNGHQRLNVLMQEHGPDYVVDARQASRALSEKEREKLTVYLHKGAAGEWDFDILANEFEIGELLEWGFAPSDFGLDGLDDFEPVDESEQPRLDQKKPVTCPSCGAEFVPG
jgi:ParB family transcriptional regulator, chromosome partitioning protein